MFKKILFTVLSLSLVFCASCGKKNNANLINGIPESAPGTTWANWNEQDMLKKREAYLKNIAESRFFNTPPIKNPPKVDLIRFVSDQEYSTTQVKCLKKFGIVSTVSYDGLSTDLNNQNVSEKELALASYKCAAMYTPDLRVFNANYPRVQAEELYKYYTTEQRQCIEKLKYKIKEPPSEQKWLEVFYAGTPDLWVPFDQAVDKLAKEEMKKNRETDYDSGESKEIINKKCPQYPPNFFPTVPSQP